MKRRWMLLTALLVAALLTAVPAQADVLLPSGMTEIEDNAFELDTSLSGHLEIPYGTTRIGDYAFGFCTGLTSVTIPDTVTEIGECAFYGCTGLESMTMPSAMEKIGVCAFYGCTGLKSVQLPVSIASIGDAAFYECGGITGDVCLIDTPDALQISWFCHEATVFNFSIRADGTLCLEQYLGGGDHATVPASAHGRKVTALAKNVFNSHTELKTITLPDTLEEIGQSAFAFCTGLTSVNIPGSVRTFEETAFYDCTALENVTLSEGLTEIGPYAFHGCTALTEITCPESLTAIGSYAFYGCTALHTVKLPQGQCTLMHNAFRGCKALTNLNLSADTTVEMHALADTGWLAAQAQAVADAVTHDGQSDYEKVVALHDWMTENNAYDQTYTYFAAEDIFLYRTGVCQAYMEAYACLLKAVGIEVKEITGTAGGEAHGWNLVRLDGEWYHVDCTWDDPVPDGNERHDYCCVPDSVMQEDHEWNAADYPAATGTKYYQGR